MRQKRFLCGVNFVFLIAVLALSVLVDANGRVASLSEGLSSMLVIAVFAGALSFAGLLIARGLGWGRWLGVALAIVYVALLLPAVLP